MTAANGASAAGNTPVAPGESTGRRSIAGLTRERPLRLAKLPEGVARCLAPAGMTLWLAGMLSDVKLGSRGVLWFTLRDGHTALDCIAAGADAARIAPLLGAGTSAPQDGDRAQVGERVVVRGALRLDHRRVSLRFGVTELVRVGPRLVESDRERTRKALVRDGLLDPARRRRLPRVPRRIALIASPSSAGHLDVVARAAARHPGIPVELVPALVQGDGAVASLIRALGRAAALPECDVIILARGGGSAADLAVFDDESLARAIVASPVPVVTAIGHETDISIADCVADLRAATPTAAATDVVPLRSDLVAEVNRLRSALSRELGLGFERERRRVARTGTALAQSVTLRLATCRRTLDRLEPELRGALAWRLGAGRTALSELERMLHDRLRESLERRHAERDALARQLIALGPRAILERGYAIPVGESGEVLGSTRQYVPGESFRLRVHDGLIEAQVTRVVG